MFIRPTNVIQFLKYSLSRLFVRRWMDLNLSDPSIPRQTPGMQFSGDEGTRTPDLLLAKEALSRLSYIPRLNWKWAFQDSDLRPRPYQRRALTN